MDLRQRTRGKRILNALKSPVSILIASAALILVGLGIRVPVLDWPSAAWLLPLLPAWLVAVWNKFADKTEAELAEIDARREQYDLIQVQNSHLRDVARRAIDYRDRIDQLVQKAGDGALSVRLRDVSNRVEEWVGRIFTLSQRVDAYRSNPVIQADLKGIPNSIGQLKFRMTHETDPTVKAEMGNAITQRQNQLTMLESLDNTMDRAELQLENALTALGTVYSQMLLIDARDINSGRTERLSESINEQMAGLNDVIGAMNDLNAPAERTTVAQGNLR